MTEFATREGLEVVETITEAKTAKVPGREQFGLVLKKIEKGEAQGIISWHPDRRSIYEQLRTIFKKVGSSR